MTTKPAGSQIAPDAPPDSPGLGVFRPPLIYSGSILTGLVLHLSWPVPLVPRALGAPLGSALVAVAILLFVYSVRQLRAADTPLRAYKPTTAIARTGPYRFSRNPIYLSFSLLHLGLAIWVDSLWLLGTLLVAALPIAWVVVPREERYLERKFGAGYLDYRTSVRRWL